MLDVLVASRRPRVLRSRWLSSSLILHLAVLAVAIEGSRVERVAARPEPADTTLLFLPRLAPPAVRREAPARPAAVGSQGGAGSLILSANPPPRGFRTVVAPSDIPSDIPPVDVGAAALDPRDFSGRGVEGGVAWGVVGGVGPVDQPPSAEDGVAEAVYEATFDDARYEPAQLVSQPMPTYPPSLLAVGISGRVVLEFIVDTLGAVEGRSIVVVVSSHRAFEYPARTSVSQAIFRPARLGARPVRQRSRQPISFVARRQ